MAIPVTHVIKGSLTRELHAMIQPYPHIRIVSLPRPLFRVGLWCWLVWQTVAGRLGWLLVDHERTLREVSWWCRMVGLKLVLIREAGQDYELWVAGERRAFACVFPR
jgi:hypothetical protein